jgi:hypothetical protein
MASRVAGSATWAVGLRRKNNARTRVVRVRERSKALLERIGLQRCGRGNTEGVLVFGVISAMTEKSVDLLLTREEAEAFITEVEGDEPELAALLRVEEIELG